MTDRSFAETLTQEWVVVVGKGVFSSCYGTWNSHDDAVQWLRENGWHPSDCEVRPVRAAAAPPKDDHGA